MTAIYTGYYKANVLEVFSGPMKSGKTSSLIARIEKLDYMKNIKYQLFKPTIDDRFDKEKIVTRNGIEINAIPVDHKNISELKQKVNDDTLVIAIDEVQFFTKDIIPLIQTWLRENRNVIIAGLELNFRGEPFGPMPELLSLADEVTKLFAVCEYTECNNRGTRTQRLIDGKPAPFSSPLILIGDTDYYEVRCVRHHEVPNEVIQQNSPPSSSSLLSPQKAIRQ